MNKISELRKQKGMTQSDLAQRLGVKKNTISQYESGKRFPNREILIKLAQILECSIDDIVKGA